MSSRTSAPRRPITTAEFSGCSHAWNSSGGAVLEEVPGGAEADRVEVEVHAAVLVEELPRVEVLDVRELDRVVAEPVGHLERPDVDVVRVEAEVGAGVDRPEDRLGCPPALQPPAGLDGPPVLPAPLAAEVDEVDGAGHHADRRDDTTRSPVSGNSSRTLPRAPRATTSQARPLSSARRGLFPHR
jgi:hypothetical protein